MPANGETVVIPGDTKLEIEVPIEVIERSISLDPTPSKRHCPFSAALIVTKEVIIPLCSKRLVYRLGHRLFH